MTGKGRATQGYVFGGIWGSGGGGVEMGFITDSALRVIPQQAQRDLCLTLGEKFKE